ncbi:aminopeptidase N [Propylenella binzhouense]|uniref:Aminopeptidase N n=1 Tax=Propylenella binzhouense TaxID=2555902 RepID=A0A964WUB8_9HYPH|nr:aminopeptidase N [Propylenella binzhouense]MYZ48873.1 aminopeptidase N [Propylenella binzhouense]
MPAEATPVIRLEDYRPTDYQIDTVQLDFLLAPKDTRVTSQLALRRRPEAAMGAPLVLDGDGLVLESVALDGRPLAATAYTATPDRLTIHAPPAGPFTLEVVTRLDPGANTALMGLYLSNGVYTTQCEAEGFRRITYFLDRPDVLAVYTTRIEAPSAATVLLSNGNRVQAGPVPGTDRHFAVWHDPFPKPSYLFALVGGDLAAIKDTFRTMSGRTVELGIYCEAGKEERCRYAMDALKRSMRWDEERFGREYDLDVFNIVAVSDFNMGAMENKGLNIFNDKYVLVDPETGTDQDYAGVETVIAHEYFHNWTGNRITCRDWFQLCLKEGLTVFRDQEFSSDMRSRPVKRIADVVALRQHQFPEDAGPLAHPPRPTRYREINNFYTATVYEKGAEICRMLKTVLGEAGFRAGMDLYFERHDGRAATIEDFLASFADATGTDLSQFALWYRQAGTPVVSVRHAYDPASERFTLALRQELPVTPDRLPKHPDHIPIAFGLVGPDGQDLSFRRAAGAEVADGVLHLTTETAEIVFEGVKARPVPSLLRGFSAPVLLRSDLTTEDRLFLIGHDPDPFSRWEAAQSIALAALEAGAAEIAAGGAPSFDPRFAEALGRLAANDELDPAFRALALTLPGEGDVAQAIGKDVDPDAIHAARVALQAAVGRAVAAIATEAAGRNAPAEPYSPDAGNAGRRALRHAAWSLSIAAGEISSDDMRALYETAGNLTDRLAAMRLACHYGLACADDVLAAFLERYRGNPLVIDKWFTVQATIPAHETADRVAALTRHPAFSMKTPNRVYALLRSFASANPVGFNRPDGAGFGLIADMIAEIDPNNPAVAARLATAFRSYAMLEPRRRAAARAALSELAARPKLSRDVSDILHRTLEG